MSAGVAALDDPVAMRHADADLLSLALIDARNHTLAWLAAFEAAEALHGAEGGAEPLALAARAGRYQDHWIGRHVQRQRGEACEANGVRLAPADASIDAWLDGQVAAPPADAVRAYLAQTLEVTLELLGHAGSDDAALHYYRLALRHEDRLGEALAECAAEMQLPAGPPWRVLPARPPREPLWLPAQRVQLGSVPGGDVPCNERWAHEVAVPEFEIDAQPVSWARFVEFADDGGYDRVECWSEAGWDWLQSEGRRAPRHVEQMRGAVLVQRHGQLQRVAAGQAALHLSRHEAEAWCRWAGRRLPTEPEWELAALTTASRGFVWGDVFEWVTGSARPWPGYQAGPGSLDALPVPGTPASTAAGGVATTGQRAGAVLRGASWMTRARRRYPKARRFAPPSCDTMFSGFRSCSV